MAVIEKRKSKNGETTYRVKIRIKGAPCLTKSFNRVTDAKRWAQKTETDIHENRYFSKVKPQLHTVSDLVDRFIAEVLPRKSKSMQEIQLHQLLWWKAQIGRCLLSDVTPGLVFEKRCKLENGKIQGGKLRSPSTCNRYVAALRHAFSIAAREWEWISDNPINRLSKLSEPSGRIRCLDELEKNKLLSECKQSRSQYLYHIVLIALSTGMRLNEIRYLTWNQVRFSEGVVIVYKAKNKQPRRVPLQGEALEMMKKHSKVRRIGSDLVFPRLSNSKLPVDIREAWAQAVKRANLTDFCFHDLRHTAASYYAMSGASARDLCDIFGWKTIQMSMRYAHLFDSHTTKIAARMNELFLLNNSLPFKH